MTAPASKTKHRKPADLHTARAEMGRRGALARWGEREKTVAVRVFVGDVAALDAMGKPTRADAVAALLAERRAQRRRGQ